MLVVNQLQRAFYFTHDEQPVKLGDPDAALTPEQVRDIYSMTYPLLVTAKIEGPEIKDDEVQFRFVSTIGTKG